MQVDQIHQAIANAHAFIEAVGLPLQLDIIAPDTKNACVSMKLFDSHAWVGITMPVAPAPKQLRVQAGNYDWQAAIVVFRQAFYAKALHGIVAAKISACGQDMGQLEAFYGELLDSYKIDTE